MYKIKVADCDVIYLSYDEPNAEQNYADLLTKIPWAKRVHGVDGSDSAHKACARLAETERVVIIDGDNIVRHDLINQEIEFYDDANTNCVISWGARNIINGLIYGNGGVKCWPTDLILNMRTHENAESDNAKTQVDFCWDINYIQMDRCMSDVYNNSSPQQAWRAGFREGVKMSLLEGSKPTKDRPFDRQVHWKNLHRLLIWMTVGGDVSNGQYAMLGARQGCYKTNCTDWDFTNVRDFKYLNSLYNEITSDLTVEQDLINLGFEIESQLKIPCPVPYTPDQSVLFKTVYINPPRMKNNLVVS
jgi:hypothetical protein